jgi:hypothetical protein
MPIAPLIPPQLTGSARTTGCAVRAPDVPWGDVKLNFDRVSLAQKGETQHIVRQSVEGIFNALMMLEWISEQSESVQRSAWDKGPFGQDHLALRAFFGRYSTRLVHQVRTDLGSMFSLFTPRQRPIFVVSGSDRLEYNPKLGELIIPAGARASQITLLAAQALGIPNSAKAATFVDKRMNAAAGCIVSEGQKSAPARVTVQPAPSKPKAVQATLTAKRTPPKPQ